MTKAELVQRLSDIEWEDFEVKEAKSEVPKSSWETVSAFSNTNGGWLVFGIKQEGKNYITAGVDNAEKIEQDFLNTVNSEKFNTRLFVTARRYKLEDKTIIGFYIPVSAHKPVYFNNQSNTFIRQGSSDRKAHPSEIDSMFRDQAYGTKTTEVVKGSSINDLNNGTVNRYRDYMRRFNPHSTYNKLTDDEFFRKTKVIINTEVSYAGLLMFGKHDSIDVVFVDFRIDLLEIPGKTYAEANPRYTYRLEEHENLWEYYFALFERIKNKIDVPFKMSDEGFSIGDSEPLKALREALVNMLMHADYFSPAKSRIRLFTDRIEFFNPGSLPLPLDELLETDVSLPRNPVLAKLFRAVRLAENAGFGFDKMINGWTKYNYKQLPVFKTNLDFNVVSFYYLTTPPINEGVNEGVKRLYELIEIFPDHRTPFYAEQLSTSVKNIERWIKELKSQNKVKYFGSSKAGGYRII